MDIIKKTLQNFSNGELSLLLGRESIEFYETVFDEKISHSQLVDSIYYSLGLGLIIDEASRGRFIERMSLVDVEYVFNMIVSIHADADLKDVSHPEDKYEFLVGFSKLDIANFISALCISDKFDSFANESSSIKGIRSVIAKYPMYPYQSKMANEVLDLIESPSADRCLMHLPTGAGKTRTAMNIAAMHLRRNVNGLVVWLADTQELSGQASNEFMSAWSCLGDRDVKNYSYYSDTDISLGGIDSGFLVAGLQKLNSLRKSERAILFDLVAKYATLVIFDEAHKAIATKNSEIASSLSESISRSSFLLGLTATPGRGYRGNNDDGNERLASFFQNKKITMTVPGYLSPVDYLMVNEYLSRPKFIDINYSDSIRMSFDNGESNVLDTLSEVDARNRKIISVVKAEVDKNAKIIIFACSIQHARALASCLCCMGIKASSLDSKLDDDYTRKSKVSSYIDGDLQVLINFNILTAGFDAPKTNVAIIARPTNSLVQYSQMVGRAMRGKKSGGNLNCTIYTVADDIDEFRDVAAAFGHWDKLWKE